VGREKGKTFAAPNEGKARGEREEKKVKKVKKRFGGVKD